MTPESLYDDNFYESHRDGAISSASVIVPVLIDLLAPRSVVDVGCGDGAWLNAFQAHGVKDLVGLDGAWAAPHCAALPGLKFVEHDLGQPINLDRSFDLALCLEVAEHLPPEGAQRFIDELTRLSRVVIFSAAIPFQGGEGHINEQWPNYWAKHFTANGYVCAANLRWRFWSDPRVMFWYRQNLLCFAAQTEDALVQRLQQAEAEWRAVPPDVAHPELYLRHCRELGESTARASHAEANARCLQGDLAQAEANVRCLQGDLAQAQTNLRQAHDELADLRRTLEDTQGELTSARTQLGFTEKELAETHAVLAGTHGELSDERKRAQALRVELDHIEISRSWQVIQRLWRIRKLLRLP